MRKLLIYLIIFSILLVNVALADTSAFWDRPANPRNITIIEGGGGGNFTWDDVDNGTFAKLLTDVTFTTVTLDDGVHDWKTEIVGDYYSITDVNAVDTPFKIEQNAPDDSICVETVTGDVGFGTCSPTEDLHIYGAAIQRLKIESTANQAAFYVKNNVGQLFMYLARDAQDAAFLSNYGLNFTPQNNRPIGFEGKSIFDDTATFKEYITIDEENVCLTNGTGCASFARLDHNVTFDGINVSGYVYFGESKASKYDDISDSLGIGTPEPTAKIHALDAGGNPQLELEYSGALTSTFETDSGGVLNIFAGGGQTDFGNGKITTTGAVSTGDLSVTKHIGMTGNITLTGSDYSLTSNGLKVAVNDWVFTPTDYSDAGMKFIVAAGGKSGVGVFNADGDEFIRFYTNGNISMINMGSTPASPTWANCQAFIGAGAVVCRADNR